jgi:hypothetical protein
MGIGHEFWHVEGMKRASFWAMDNIKAYLKGIGLRIIIFVHNKEMWREY